MNPYIIEACVENLDQAINAQNNGADQIELCADLEHDGLTPSIELIKEVCARVSIPVKVMIRSRAGDFIYSKNEMEIMVKEAREIRDLDLVSGMVFGALTREKKLDIPSIIKIAEAIKPLPLTIHKAIDEVAEPQLEIDSLKEIVNVDSILSSGGKGHALDNIAALINMLEACGNKITLIVGGGVKVDNLNEIHEKLRARAYHGRRIVF